MHKNLIKIKNFLKHTDKKSLYLIIKETLSLWIENKRFPIHYFTRLAFINVNKDYKYFLETNIIKELQESNIFHTEKSKSILGNKLNFHDFCVENNISTPKIISINKNNDFYINDRLIKVDNLDDFIVFVKQLLELTESNSIFFKPINSGKGIGCLKLDEKDLNNTLKINESYESVIKTNYIYQETITQHDQINRINPDSINTIRIDTYISKDGVPKVMSAVLRVGRKGSIVDNASAGGFFIPINIDNGRLIAPGFQILQVGSTVYYKHPDTNVILGNLEIPYFMETVKMISDAALKIGDRLVGWDVAILENGPTIIEGNYNYSIDLNDIGYNGYKKHPIFKEVMNELVTI